MSGDARSPEGVAGGARPPAETGARASEEKEPAPTGTLFFMILFLLLMVGLWVTVYWMLLER